MGDGGMNGPPEESQDDPAHSQVCQVNYAAASDSKQQQVSGEQRYEEMGFSDSGGPAGKSSCFPYKQTSGDDYGHVYLTLHECF